MKKIFKLILAMVLCLSVSVVAFACDLGDHDHEYESGWTTNESYHWHACTFAGCGLTVDKAGHEFDEGVIDSYATPISEGVKTFTCTVCGYAKSENFAFDGVIVSTIEELNDALATGGTIALDADIQTANTIYPTVDTTIIGCGKTITYTGTNRAIDVIPDTNGANLTLVNLTISSTANWCERGVNYNTTGTLTLDNVTIAGTRQNYAVNLPGKSDGAKVVINNSEITSFIALNIWGENTEITITNSDLYSVGSTKTDCGGAISINVDAGNHADNCILTVEGGKISSLYTDNTPALAIRNYADGTVISISETTQVVGDIVNDSCVATVAYPPTYYFYAYKTLQDAVDKNASDLKNGTTNSKVVLTSDITVETLVVLSEVVIDLNGYTLTVTTLTDEGNALTIIGNGVYNGVQQ